MGESGYGLPADLAAAAASSGTNSAAGDIPTLEATLTIDRSPPNVIVDDSSLGEHRDRNAENLKLRLGMRRDIGTLVSQGIMPPMHSPQAFFEQKQRLERAVISDKIKAKLQRRPPRDILVQQHILEEAGNYVDPSLVEKHKQLKRARLADQLNRCIMDRPGPLEVIQAGILHVDDSLENDVKGGKIHFKKTCEGAIAKRPLRPFTHNFEEDDEEEDATGGAAAAVTAATAAPPPPNAVVMGIDDLSPPASAASSSSQSPRAQLHPYKSESLLAEFSPPPSCGPSDSGVVVAPSPSLPVSRCASVPLFATTKETASLPTFVPGARTSSGKLLQRSAGGGKARTLKNKSNGSQSQKQKVYTFHVYHGPSSGQSRRDSPSFSSSKSSETKYEILVQQQQTILQYELEGQQKRLLPSTTRPKSSDSSSSTGGRRNSQSASESSGPKSLSKMEDMKVQDLKAEAKMRGLPVSGTKAQLIERLQPYADVSTSAALGSVSTNATPTVTAVVAHSSSIPCFSLPVYAATAAPATAVIVKPAETHHDVGVGVGVGAGATFATAASHLDQDMPTPLSMPMDIDEAMPLTAVSLTPVFSASAGVPVILNVTPSPADQPAELAPPPPPPLPTTLAGRGVNVVVNVPVVNVPVALPLAQQSPIVAIAAAPGAPPSSARILTHSQRQSQYQHQHQPQFVDENSAGMIHEIMNQFKELREQLDNSDAKTKTSDVPKINFQWPLQPEERNTGGVKLSWRLGSDVTQITLPSATPSSSASSSWSLGSFAKPMLEPARTSTWQQPALADNSNGTFGSGFTFTIDAAVGDDENPNVSDIQPSFTFGGDSVKSQLVDDIISIAVKNGDLPARAANDLLTPTPEPERMESGPSFPALFPRMMPQAFGMSVNVNDTVNNNNNNNSASGDVDASSPMNDENSNIDSTPPPPTPPPLPAQQLGVSLLARQTGAKDDPTNVEMSTSDDAADFHDFLSILGNTAQSTSACDFFSDMDLSLLDNCGNLGSSGNSGALAATQLNPALPPPQHQMMSASSQQPRVKVNGYVVPTAAVTVGNPSAVNVDVGSLGTLLDSWATAASSLSSSDPPPVFTGAPSDHFDAQVYLDCWTSNVP